MEDGPIKAVPCTDGPLADGNEPGGEQPPPHPARILISSSRKPVSYINLAKRFLQEHSEVQLSALGIAVSPMVTVAEILKGRRLAVVKKVVTSLESLSGEYRTRQKPKMEVLLVKSDVFEEVMADVAQRYGTFDNEAPYDDQEDANTREGTGEVIEEANLPDGPEASAALAVPGMGQGRACVKSDEDGPC